jgi:NosR/NirI family nitrous oxide reductase transcriptional regulator
VNPFRSYMHWLHTRWPAGRVEKMPEVGEDGATRVPGVRIVGDLTGIPLLKFSTLTGARAVRAFAKEPGFRAGTGGDVDLVIIGAGVSGMAAALEAAAQGMSFRIFDASEAFTTIANFPKKKPIYTYPTDLDPDSPLRVSADVKEDLLDELRVQTSDVNVEPVRVDKIERKQGLLHVIHAGGKDVTTAQRVIVAIGRSGNYRRLGVPGQDKDKVYHRLYDPAEYTGQRAIVVGGGDSALETAIALASNGADVTLSYRKKELSRPEARERREDQDAVRGPGADVAVEDPTSDRVNAASGAFMPKPTQPGRLRLMLGSKLEEIRDDDVELTDADGQTQTLPNDVVFAMIGREAPLDFFRRSGSRSAASGEPRRGHRSSRSWPSALSCTCGSREDRSTSTSPPGVVSVQRAGTSERR